MKASNSTGKLLNISLDEAKQMNEVLMKVQSSQAATYVPQANSNVFFYTPITTVRQEVQKILHQPKN